MTTKIITHDSQRVNTRTSTPTEELSAVLINLLEFIYNHSKLYGYAWHSNAYIALHTHCTERTITRRLKVLADAGYIAIYYKHGERHIRPLRVYPVSTQCLTINTKPKGYTKENNTVISTENLEEKTEQEESVDSDTGKRVDDANAQTANNQSGSSTNIEPQRIHHSQRHQESNGCSLELATTPASARGRGRGRSTERNQSEDCGNDAGTGGIGTLTAHGVDTAQAQRIASQHTQEAIARAIAYANQQEARKGRLTNKAGFIRDCLTKGWSFKLLDVSPETIAKRQERLRIRTEGATMVMGGVAPDMAMLRGRLGA